MFRMVRGCSAARAVLACAVALFSATAAAQEAHRQPRQNRPERQDLEQRYSIDQALSENAQLHTIAFSGLAFLTGDYGACTFLPPGKVCDYFGFQYMRDIDAARKGHNPMFLNRVTGNVLKTLTPDQRAVLEQLAREQAPQYRELAELRWPVIKAFWLNANEESPKDTHLSCDAVVGAIADIFARDAAMSYRRAEVVGGIIASLTTEQQDVLATLKFGDFSTWPEVDTRAFKLPRGTEKLVNVAYMTYASELFSWYAGSVEADTYFCPERHGTYFGGFYMKDMPAMGKTDYDISTAVTGESGEGFLRILTPEQRRCITDIPAAQKDAMKEIVEIRQAISNELRKFMEGETPDRDKVVALGRRYGKLDGGVSYLYATAFAEINHTLTDEQRASLMKLRNLDGYTSAPAYIYSDAVHGDLGPIETGSFFVESD